VKLPYSEPSKCPWDARVRRGPKYLPDSAAKIIARRKANRAKRKAAKQSQRRNRRG